MMTAARLKHILLTTALGRVALVPYRFWLTARPGLRKPWPYLRWLLLERELTNFSYRLTATAKATLCELVDSVAAQAPGTARGHLAAFEAGGTAGQMLAAIDKATARSPFRHSQNPRALFDQRLVYYLLVRALKPRLVFQSGTARGVGACLIGQALNENAADGYAGRLVTSDIDPAQGYVLVMPFARRVSFVAGDSVRVLEGMHEPIDLYIHDTSPETLAEREFAALDNLMAPAGILLSTWSTFRTRATAARWNKSHREWKDEPAQHWYEGVRVAVIGDRRHSL